MFVRIGFLAGVIAMLGFTAAALVGCNSKAPVKTAKEHDHEHGEHEHPSEGPHHGELIELGSEEYHAELVDDDAARSVSIYLLDSSAKNSVPTTESDSVSLNGVVNGEPKQYRLARLPDGGLFKSDDATLFQSLHDPKASRWRLNVSIKGKSYNADIEEHEHNHHHDK